jgi:hypothetical protein
MIDGVEHEFVAHSIDKPWVKKSDEFRLAAESPELYFVAIGQPDYTVELGERPARQFAEENLKPLIASALPNMTPHFRGYTENSKLMTALSKHVAKDLITDRFVQTFRRHIDGKSAGGRARRDAVLVDCSQSRFDSALTDALRKVSRGHAYPTQRIDEEVLMAFGVLAGVLFVVLLGISRFFDRRLPPLNETNADFA